MSDAAFHRWVDPAGKGAIRSAHKIEASEAERAALAAWLDIPAVARLTADLLVTRTGTESAEVTGNFSADLTLICGVSLEEFPQTLSGTVKRDFRRPHAVALKRHGEPAPEEIVVDLDTEEPGEWRPQGVDLGAVLAEELSLTLPDFPRKPGAALEDAPEAPAEDEKPNPFAALARLKGEGG